MCEELVSSLHTRAKIAPVLHMCDQYLQILLLYTSMIKGAQWLSGRVLDLRPKGRGFEPHRRESQEDSTFPAGDHKASTNRRA